MMQLFAEKKITIKLKKKKRETFHNKTSALDVFKKIANNKWDIKRWMDGGG